jgi:hypothetical protein
MKGVQVKIHCKHNLITFRKYVFSFLNSCNLPQQVPQT